MCELGLRAGGAARAKRLLGRKELKRGLKALSAQARIQAMSADEPSVETPGVSSSPTSINTRGDGWSEKDVDELMAGLVLCRDKRGVASDVGSDSGKDRDMTEEAFRDGLELALGGDGDKMDRAMAGGLKALPLCERLEVRLTGGVTQGLRRY